MAVGDITDDLLNELGIRLEDAGQNVFTHAFKLEALNKAQKQLAQLLHNGYLTELEKSEPSLSVSGGSYTITSLNSSDGVFRGAEGILKTSVQIGGSGNYIFATEVDIRNIKSTENDYCAGSDVNPLYYIFSSTIYYLITTYTATVATIYYLTKPTAMGGTADTTPTDPTLNKALHPLIVTLAEAICWAMDGKLDRRTAAYEIALTEITMLNERYTPAEGIGTKGREILRR